MDIRDPTSADGTRLHAFAAGSPTNPAVLCLHGFAATSFSFSRLFQSSRLLEKVYLVAFDMRGNGRSGMPLTKEGYAGDRYAEDFQAVCEAFGIVKPVLLAWSLGGIMLGDIINMLGASAVSGIIYAGGAVPTRPIHSKAISSWLLASLPPFLSNETSQFAPAAVDFVLGCFANPDEALTYDEKVHWLGELLLAPPITRVLSEEASRERETAKWEQEVTSGRVRALVIEGRDDKMIDGEKMKREMESVWPEGSLEWVWLGDVGHHPCWERPREVVDEVIRFVEKVTMGTN